MCDGVFSACFPALKRTHIDGEWVARLKCTSLHAALVELLLHATQSSAPAEHMHQLHALNHLDSGVDLPALLRCLEVARNIYGYMIQ